MSNSLLTSMGISGFSGVIATTILHPFDTLKVNLQTSYNSNPLIQSKKIYNLNGIAGFYKGILPAWNRQIVYTSLRLGIFKYIYDNNKEGLSFGKKILTGGFSGLVGSFFSSPLDLVMVKQQSLQKSNTKTNKYNTYNTFKILYRKIGFMGFWKNSIPTIVRATVLNSAMLTSNFQTKEYLVLQKYSDKYINTIPYLVGGFSSVIFSMPFDHIKTNYQLENNSEKTKYYLRYVINFIKQHGFSSLYKSLPVYTVRIMPHSIISLYIINAINSYLLY